MIEPETSDADHGRLEQKRHSVCHDVAWLWSDRRYAGEPSFPQLAMIGMVEKTKTECGGKTAYERRYYLFSAKLDAKTFAAALRAHWHIENQLHWVLDVVVHDDLARLRSGAGSQNMAVIKHMATNLVREKTDKHSLKARRKLANLTPTIWKHSSGLSHVNLKRFPWVPDRLLKNAWVAGLSEAVAFFATDLCAGLLQARSTGPFKVSTWVQSRGRSKKLRQPD